MPHYFEVEPRNAAAARCVHCGLVARVRFYGMGGGALRLGTQVFAVNGKGKVVRPGTIKCDAARGGA